MTYSQESLRRVHEKYREHEHISFEKFEKEFGKSWGIIKKNLRILLPGLIGLTYFSKSCGKKLKKFNAALIIEFYELY